MPIIIDGYNYLYARGGLEKLLPFDDFAEARADMLEFLELYRKVVRRKVIVVLDGSRPDGPEGRGCGGLEVVYPDTDADSAIEEIVRNLHSLHKTTVVSSDQAVKRAVTKLDAVAVGSGKFHRLAVKKVERRRHAKRDPQQKHDPPAADDVTHWEQQFAEADSKNGDEPGVRRRIERDPSRKSTPPAAAEAEKQPKSAVRGRKRPRAGSKPPRKDLPPGKDEVDYWLEQFGEKSDG